MSDVMKMVGKEFLGVHDSVEGASLTVVEDEGEYVLVAERAGEVAVFDEWQCGNGDGKRGPFPDVRRKWWVETVESFKRINGKVAWVLWLRGMKDLRCG